MRLIQQRAIDLSNLVGECVFAELLSCDQTCGDPLLADLRIECFFKLRQKATWVFEERGVYPIEKNPLKARIVVTDN